MDHSAAEEIIACLPRGRTLFYYCPDRYAALLLSYVVGNQEALRDIRNSRFGKLLDRPLIADLAATKGDGKLSRADLDLAWTSDPECYLLTLGIWGPEVRGHWRRDYHQTSMPGVNLVLQLNFSTRHNRPYRELIDPGAARPFEFDLHPIARRGFHTLAWARLDIDLAGGEALIEEVQTDWLRRAAYASHSVERLRAGQNAAGAGGKVNIDGTTVGVAALKRYIKEVLAVHVAIWDEAILSAEIWFLVDELGIRNIYYHDHESGLRLKNIAGSGPPRSLYSRLPRKFCFGKIVVGPGFLHARPSRALKTLDRAGALRFCYLNI